jgi:hypothetical protein
MIGRSPAAAIWMALMVPGWWFLLRSRIGHGQHIKLPNASLVGIVGCREAFGVDQGHVPAQLVGDEAPDLQGRHGLAIPCRA